MFSKLAANFAQKAATATAGSTRRVAFQARFVSGQTLASGTKGKTVPFQTAQNGTSLPATFTIRVRCAIHTTIQTVWWNIAIENKLT